MNNARHLSSAVLDRRHLCCTIAGLVVSAVAARLPSWTAPSPELVVADQEYLIINGWVLTRKDVATMELPPNVIRLQ